MDDGGMNHYEQQLYTVFKTFDVDNAEALDRAAVLQLCDALQLEGRGAALVESLFERRTERVTFATFRNGLLGVLGAEPAPEPSDDDSSGREVAPKFVFGSKKYGRRSRPARADDAAAAPRAASASRLDADAGARPRMRYKRSASAMEARTPPPDLLDHERRIDRAQAAALCRDLHMDTIDPRLVDRIFDDAPAEETTVGEFFDRLNAALTPLAAGEATVPTAIPPPDPPDGEDDAEGAVTGEAIAEAWERAGVRRPRRLLAELGFTATTLSPAELERALDDELRALPAREERDARPLLQQAALALSRLRRANARARAAAAVAERDKLRADLAEANRRAQLLAQDVDENHARLEAERQAALRLLEARHAETTRAVSNEAAAERERAATIRAELEAEVARRGDLEAKLRAELTALQLRSEQLERRVSAAEERATAAERERARTEEEAREAAAQAGREVEERRVASEALERQVLELREECSLLRDRADELQAGLEARRGAAPPPAAATSWRDEAELAADADAALDRIEDCDSSPPSIERLVFQTDAARRLRSIADSLSPECARCEAAAAALRELSDSPAARGLREATAARGLSEAPTARGLSEAPTAPRLNESVEAAVQTEESDEGKRIEELQKKHDAEKSDLNNLIAELEASIEALREEYERCEEYWAGKLADERSLAADEAAASDARLSELLARVAEYEAQFKPRLPALHESELEPQYEQLAQEFESFKIEAARALATARADADKTREELEKARTAPTPLCSCRQKTPLAPRPASDGDQRLVGSHPPGSGDMSRRSVSAGALAHAALRVGGGVHVSGGGGGGVGSVVGGGVDVGDAPSAHDERTARVPQPHLPGACACAALASAWRRAAAAEGAGLRARAAHAERAAARLLARLQAADALVAELYRENCQLQHHARPEPRLL
ncbi:ninein-like protein [Cydia pomonella]|uniref:ninein-like protein n=1 Tax=Cydia pomonella TaxID=82600 RepID=UPI002ADDC98C|nr:ninein-like protein [Cydia pomonella]